MRISTVWSSCPAGDAAVTRRASKYSKLRAVVVRWSRTRKRYERQGILVEPEALRRAEEESLADAEVRARRQARAAERRETEDHEFVAAFASAIREQYPGCPTTEETEIAEHACRKYSGRVGRTAAAKELSPEAIRLAVIAHIRHAHTNYDELLARYADRDTARERVRGKVSAILDDWQRPGRVRKSQRLTPSPTLGQVSLAQSGGSSLPPHGSSIMSRPGPILWLCCVTFGQQVNEFAQEITTRV